MQFHRTAGLIIGAMSETAATPVTAPELVKAVDAAIKAAGANETGRTCDSLKHLAKQQVTAALLLSTGAGKKVPALLGFPAAAWLC